MPLLDSNVESEIDDIKRAASEIVRYSYRWLFGSVRSFSDVTDFLSKFDTIEKSLDANVAAYDIFNELMELAIAARISSFANDVGEIRESFGHQGTEYGNISGMPPRADHPVTPELQQKIRITLSLWRERFASIQGLSFAQLRALPSVADSKIIEEEVRAFDISLRLRSLQPKSNSETELSPVFHCRDIDIAHGDNFRLHIDSFNVSKGEIVACVGPNGSGKTTFLRFLAGWLQSKTGGASYPFIDAAAGSLDYAAYWPHRRRRIAFVSEEPFPGEMGVDKRIALNLADAGVLGESNRALTNLFLERFRLFGCLGRIPSELSSGEKKLAGIASALAAAPDLILLDEPLSSLDYIATIQLLDDIQRMAKGALWGKPAVVLSTHHLDEPNWLADRVYFFSNGLLSECSKDNSGSVFEITTRSMGVGGDVRLREEFGLRLEYISGRTFVASKDKIAIEATCSALAACSISLTSINDITDSPKRYYLGM